MEENPYRKLAQRLDSLPNGFPSTEDGSELRLLMALFTPQEAELAAQLRLTLETAVQIAARIGGEADELGQMLKSMARRGLVKAGRAEGGLGYGLLPFVVGIYELQVGRIDAELARLFEDYYSKAFSRILDISPPVHRVLPVGESVKSDIDIRPYESAMQIVAAAQSWGVIDCICRKQKMLLGDPCEHPLDVCIILHRRPGAFDNSPDVRTLTKEEAEATLERASRAGLVHSVSNNQVGNWYICNCCTCSCGVLRGLSEMGIAGVVAHAPFVNTVDEERCIACEDCLEYCQFDALSLDRVARVDSRRCVGCGVCVPACPEGALILVRRSEEQIVPVPQTEAEWMQLRAAARGIDLSQVL